MKKEMSKFLWAEKYRPQSVRDMVLPEKFKKFFEDCVSKKQIPNLLLYSTSPGSGKTSIAKAICSDLNADYIYINISEDSGIDTLRSTIRNFASTKSAFGGTKIVILDEFDFAGPNLQAGLRGAVEEFHKQCRFIITCNYISKIIPALRQGRFMEFDFSMTDKETTEEMIPKHLKRFESLLKFEKVEYDKDVLKEIVTKNYPNMRKTIALLQQQSAMYGMIGPNSLKSNKVSSELYDFILRGDFTEARKFIIESAYDPDELYPALYREFVPMLNKKHQAQTIITLAQYQNMSVSAIDKELNLAACILEIIGIIDPRNN